MQVMSTGPPQSVTSTLSSSSSAHDFSGNGLSRHFSSSWNLELERPRTGPGTLPLSYGILETTWTQQATFYWMTPLCCLSALTGSRSPGSFGLSHRLPFQDLWPPACKVRALLLSNRWACPTFRSLKWGHEWPIFRVCNGQLSRRGLLQVWHQGVGTPSHRRFCRAPCGTVLGGF